MIFTAFIRLQRLVLCLLGMFTLVASASEPLVSSVHGMFALRTGGGKSRATTLYGGTKESSAAVLAALKWFQKHQDKEGFWNPETYQLRCSDGTQCEPGRSLGANNLGITGQILCCFLGAGYDHKINSRFRDTVTRGLAWILKNQEASGGWGNVQDSAICAQVLLEAYGMTYDPALLVAAQNAVRFLQEQQNLSAEEKLLGWDQKKRSQCNDTAVSARVLLALVTAQQLHFDVGTSLDGANDWLESAWKTRNPGWAKLNPVAKDCSIFPARWMSGAITPQLVPDDTASSAGAFCALLLGHPKGDLLLETLCQEILTYEFPKMQTLPCDLHALSDATLTVFFLGGDRWTTWNTAVRDMLVKSQRTELGCFQGSWDSKDMTYPGHEIGRLQSTVYACLCLEVYSRFNQQTVFSAPEEK
jgi:hypothetical protein